MITPQPNYYLGVIKKIIDPDKYEVEIEIPGLTKEAKAFPIDRSPDEPKPEDLVLVLGLDPTWTSFWLYQKLKENEFIGFRSRGKKVDITKDRIEIGIFSEMNEKDQKTPPYEEDATPKSTSWISIDKDGNIDIKAETNININVEGACILKAKQVSFPEGTVMPNPKGGPFCALKNCPVLKIPHTGNLLMG